MNWNIELITGYKPQTNLWGLYRHFDICNGDVEWLTENIIKKNKDNEVIMTELVMVLNWSCWGYHDIKQDELSRKYEKLYRQVDSFVLDLYENDERKLNYYLQTID